MAVLETGVLAFNRVLVLLAPFIIGFYFRRKGILKDDFVSSAPRLVSRIGVPCYIISAVLNPTLHLREYGSMVNFGLVLMGIIIILILFGVFLLNPILGISNKSRAQMTLAPTLFAVTNIVFTGIPIMTAVMGEEILIYGMTAFIAQDCIIWTVVISLYAYYGTSMSKTWKKMVNPVTIIYVVAISSNLMGWKLPEFVYSPVKNIGDIILSFSFVFMGAVVGDMNFREFMQDKSCIIFAFLKLIVTPILLTVLFFHIYDFGLDYFGKMAIILLYTTSSVSTISTVHKDYGLDYLYSTRLIQFTLISSMLSIPIMAVVVEFISKL